jgi:thiopurine S-methyltransferase
MNNEFWINRWAENQIGFHRKGVNPLLDRFWPGVAEARSGTVLVPLCGKSEDLLWLADREHEVIGIELSLTAAEAFAAEQKIVLAETHEPPFTVLRGERIAFYVGDFFDFSAPAGARADYFYDRAALIALPPELRPAYSRHLQSLIADNARGLLITVEYDASQMHGPPFTVPEAEVRRLFVGFDCKKVLEYDCLDEEPRFKARGLTWMKEIVYVLNRDGR